jgi:hypothetical protein
MVEEGRPKVYRSIIVRGRRSATMSLLGKRRIQLRWGARGALAPSPDTAKNSIDFNGRIGEEERQNKKNKRKNKWRWRMKKNSPIDLFLHLSLFPGEDKGTKTTIVILLLKEQSGPIKEQTTASSRGSGWMSGGGVGVFKMSMRSTSMSSPQHKGAKSEQPPEICSRRDSREPGAEAGQKEEDLEVDAE